MSSNVRLRQQPQCEVLFADATHPDNFVVVDVAFFPAVASTVPQHGRSRLIPRCASHGPSLVLTIASTLRRSSCDTPALPWSRINCHRYQICGKDRLTATTSGQSSTAFRVSDRSGTPQAGRTPAATPSGSIASLVERMLNAATPSGSNAAIRSVTLNLTPKGSQPLERERPHAMTTLKGSQPEFCVRDRSGKPAADERRRGLAADSPTRLHLSRGTPNTSTSSV